jgi:hypothetical protein
MEIFFLSFLLLFLLFLLFFFSTPAALSANRDHAAARRENIIAFLFFLEARRMEAATKFGRPSRKECLDLVVADFRLERARPYFWFRFSAGLGDLFLSLTSRFFPRQQPRKADPRRRHYQQIVIMRPLDVRIFNCLFIFRGETDTSE